MGIAEDCCLGQASYGSESWASPKRQGGQLLISFWRKLGRFVLNTSSVEKKGAPGCGGLLLATSSG